MEDYDADLPSWEMFDAQIDWPATLARNFASFAGFTRYSRRLSEMKEYFSPRLLDGKYIPIKAVARLLAGETDKNPQLTGGKPQAKAKSGWGRSLVSKLWDDICRIWSGPMLTGVGGAEGGSGCERYLALGNEREGCCAPLLA
jgi:hypothetical protein